MTGSKDPSQPPKAPNNNNNYLIRVNGDDDTTTPHVSKDLADKLAQFGITNPTGKLSEAQLKAIKQATSKQAKQ